MGQYLVSARKYRPSTFDEVVGQHHVAATLKNAIQTGKLAHAFLFTGPRGVGKTTCARILAKVINCEDRGEMTDPCKKCSSCKSFDENASFNIFELDAASNNSVEHIRNLIEQVRFQPQQGSYKVFIIDEVHMLSTQAFNAFLKTLEEPPSYAIFILATTEKHKIIPTILSRCQIFDFKRIQTPDIVQQLKHICKVEGRNADPEALHQIAIKSDGAMRDALSIYDKIVSATNDKITYQDVVANLNLLDYDFYFRSVDAALKSDLSSLLLIFDDIVKNGFDPEIYIQGLSNHIRDLLVSKDVETIKLMDGSKELKQRYFDQSSLANDAFLLSALNVLNECDLNLPRANNKRLQVELALAKVCYLSNIRQVDVFEIQEGTEKKTPLKSKKETAAKSDQLEKAISEHEVFELTDEDAHTASLIQKTPGIEQHPKDIKENLLSKLEIPTVLGQKKSNHLERIKHKIRKDEQEKQSARKNLSTEGVYECWIQYVTSHSSNSLQAALKNPIIELQDKSVIVTLPSPVAKGYAMQESGLMDSIRETFGTPDLTLSVIVDKSRFPEYIEEEKVKTYFTHNEAMEELMKSNPKLIEFIKKFDLKADAGQ